MNATVPFRELVAALSNRGVPDAYQAALAMLADVQSGGLPQSNPLSIAESNLRSVLEETRRNLSRVLDWISLSDTARRRGETTLTPDIAQLLTDLVIEGGHSHAVVLQDPLCLMASRLTSAGVCVEQYCSGSDVPERCVAIAGAPTWTFIGGSEDAVGVKSTSFLPFPRVTKVSPNDVAIAAFPLIPGVSGGAHSKQLPYAASEDLCAVISTLGATITRLIALVPSSMLYRTGRAAEFRNDLLSSGRVEAVLELPNGVTPLATHQYSVLVLRLSRGVSSDETVFAMSLPERPSMATRGRGRRIEVESSRALARQIIDGRTDGSKTNRKLTREEIARIGSLLPRMMLGGSSSQGAAASGSATLVDLVQVLRPAALPAGTSRLSVGVSTESIVRASPYIRFVDATRNSTGETESVKAHETAADLQPGDIVMVAKGAIGAMGLVENAFAGPVFVPNSCLVLRPKSPRHAEALYLFLKSQTGRERLRQIVTGSTVRNIRISDLGGLVVPLPSHGTSAIAREALRAINEKTVEIQRLEEERTRLLADALMATFENGR